MAQPQLIQIALESGGHNALGVDQEGAVWRGRIQRATSGEEFTTPPKAVDFRHDGVGKTVWEADQVIDVDRQLLEYHASVVMFTERIHRSFEFKLCLLTANPFFGAKRAPLSQRTTRLLVVRFVVMI